MIQDGLNQLIRLNSDIFLSLDAKSALAASTVKAKVFERVFENGLDSNNNEIGQYSTEPTYVGASSFITKTAANKVLGSKKKRKTLYAKAKAAGKAGFVPKKSSGSGGKGAIYFEEGYKGIREAEGSRTDKVDLSRTGKLQASYQSGKTDRGFVLGFTNEDDYKKMRGNEKRFETTITDLTPEEIQCGVDILAGVVTDLF